MTWKVAQLDDELADWRALREKHAATQHSRAEALAAEKEFGSRGRAGGCRRCSCALVDGRKIYCKVCGLAEYWRRQLVVAPLENRKDNCGAETFEGYCRKCGTIEEWPRHCGAKQVCDPCAKRHYTKQADKLERALSARLTECHAEWTKGGRHYGRRPAVALITLGVSNSGDVEGDRAMLSKAWNRWRTWYAKTYGEKLCYSWVPECTDGKTVDSDGNAKGNPHLHVACLLPYRDYRQLIAAWSNATEGQGRRIDVRSELKTPKRAAKYIAKYASKGTKTLKTPALAAAWVRAQHRRRSVSTSYGFWLPDPMCAHAKLALARARETWLTNKACRAHQSNSGLSRENRKDATESPAESRGPPDVARTSASP